MELFIITIAWILGIIWGLYLKISIVFFFVLIILIILILYCLFTKVKEKKKIVKYLIIIILSFSISNVQVLILENSFTEKYRNLKEETKELKIIGTVVSEPIKKEYRTQYVIKIDKINGNVTYKNTKIILNVKKETNCLEYGNQICIYGIFESPEVQRNEGGFDYSQYLKIKKIYKIVTVEENKIKIIKQSNINVIYKTINIIKNSIKKQINKQLPEKEANLLIGILIGDKSNIEEEISEDFSNSSLSHILAVSGMHVSYVIIGIGFLVNKIKISKNFSKIIIIILLIFFMLLTGRTPSVERACMMSIYMIISRLLHKRNNVLSSISISMLLILIENPYAISDIGLQLSYGGTIGIVSIYPILKKHIKLKKKIENKNIKKDLLIKIKSNILDIILITISANIVIFPIMLYHFNTVSLTFVISNLLVSQIIGIIILLGFLTTILSYILEPISIILFIILKIFLNLLILIAHFTSNLPFSKIYLPTPKIYIIIIYYTVLIYIILKKNKIPKNKIIKNKTKIIVIALLISLLINFIFYKIIDNDLKIYFIDVGQGDSTLICTPNKKKILIDGGGTLEREVFDVGEKTLLPYLLDKGITKLDYVIITHFDSDHIGGILTILEKLQVKQIVIGKQYEIYENYKEFNKIVKKKKLCVKIVEAGEKIQVEKDLYFNVLWPDSNNMISENSINNNSLVCKLVYKQFSCIFTGDIEEIAEEKILTKYKKSNILKSTVLKIAHHGSKTSSIEEFLKSVNPNISLIGVGKNNMFGHPNQEIIERIKNIDSKIYRTDKSGEIIVNVNKSGKIRLKTKIK